MKTHMWTFLTNIPSICHCLCLSLTLSLCLLPPQHNFPLSRHIKSGLHVHVQCDEYGCDLFLWRLAARLPSRRQPPQAQDTTSQWAQRALETEFHPRWKHTSTHPHTHTHWGFTLIITGAHPQIYIHKCMHACTHGRLSHALVSSLLPLSADLSQCVLHKNKRRKGRQNPEDWGEGGCWFLIHFFDTSNETMASGLCLYMREFMSAHGIRALLIMMKT